MGMYPDFQGHRTRQFGRQIESRLTRPFILVDTVPVLQCYNCPPIISVEFVKVKLRIPGGHGNPEEGEHRKSFTVVSCVL